MKDLRVFMLLSTAVVAGGCATGAVDQNYGKAVKQVTREQISDPNTLNGGGDRPVTGIDQEYATHMLDSYRKDVPPREAVKQDITLKIGAQGGNGGNQ